MSGSIARRYARALMDIGVEDGNYAKYGKEVAGLAEAFADSQEFAEAQTNPAFSRDLRKSIVAALTGKAGASTAVANFMQLLVDKDRLTALPAINRELAALIEEKEQSVTAEVTTAVALTPAQSARIVKALEKISGKKVSLAATVDPAIIGGGIAQVGDSVFDGSIKQKLTELGQQMVK